MGLYGVTWGKCEEKKHLRLTLEVIPKFKRSKKKKKFETRLVTVP